MSEVNRCRNGLHLKDLTRPLKKLDLDYTHVTDAGLVHLKGLTNLSELSVRPRYHDRYRNRSAPAGAPLSKNA